MILSLGHPYVIRKWCWVLTDSLRFWLEIPKINTNNIKKIKSRDDLRFIPPSSLSNDTWWVVSGMWGWWWLRYMDVRIKIEREREFIVHTLTYFIFHMRDQTIANFIWEIKQLQNQDLDFRKVILVRDLTSQAILKIRVEFSLELNWLND